MWIHIKSINRKVANQRESIVQLEDIENFHIETVLLYQGSYWTAKRTFWKSKI